MPIEEAWRIGEVPVMKVMLEEDKAKPDLIKLFWRSVTLRHKFKPIRGEYSGHMTFLSQ